MAAPTAESKKNALIVGASIARPLLAGGAIRIKASKNRHYMCPTGDNGNNIFCTRALFRIAANPRRCLTCDNGNRRYISCLLGQSGVGLE